MLYDHYVHIFSPIHTHRTIRLFIANYKHEILFNFNILRVNSRPPIRIVLLEKKTFISPDVIVVFG